MSKQEYDWSWYFGAGSSEAYMREVDWPSLWLGVNNMFKAVATNYTFCALNKVTLVFSNIRISYYQMILPMNTADQSKGINYKNAVFMNVQTPGKFPRLQYFRNHTDDQGYKVSIKASDSERVKVINVYRNTKVVDHIYVKPRKYITVVDWQTAKFDDCIHKQSDPTQVLNHTMLFSPVIEGATFKSTDYNWLLTYNLQMTVKCYFHFTFSGLHADMHE